MADRYLGNADVRRLRLDRSIQVHLAHLILVKRRKDRQGDRQRPPRNGFASASLMLQGSPCGFPFGDVAQRGREEIQGGKKQIPLSPRRGRKTRSRKRFGTPPTTRKQETNSAGSRPRTNPAEERSSERANRRGKRRGFVGFGRRALSGREGGERNSSSGRRKQAKNG